MGNKQLNQFGTHSIYGNTDILSFTIPSGADGSAVAPRHYNDFLFSYVTISCDDITGINGLSFNIMVSETRGGVLKPLIGPDKQKFEFTVSETFFISVFIAGIVDIQIRLVGGNASQETIFNIRLIDTGGDS